MQSRFSALIAPRQADVDSNSSPQIPAEERTIVKQSVDLARKVTRFLLAAFLWSHALFVVDAQSKLLVYLKTQIPRGSVENRPTGVTSKPANGVAQDVILIYPVFS